MNLLLLKLIMTPLIIAGATLIARRYGENIGGLIIGLPLTSGPVSLFFALEQGSTFAAGAAKGSIMGLIPVAVFCTGYVQSARRLPWYLAALVSSMLYLAAILGMSLIAPNLGTVAVLVPLVLCLALTLVQSVRLPDRLLATPWWDLPLRMVIATTMLLLITTAAGALGPTWSGMLSPFPIFTFVMATFSHSQGGAAAAWRLIRGVLTGLFSYVLFFIVVGLLVDNSSLPLAYLLATAAALGLNGLTLAYVIWKRRATNLALQRQ